MLFKRDPKVTCGFLPTTASTDTTERIQAVQLMDGDEEVNSMMNLNWLYVDSKGTIWEIGKKGRVFRYDTKHDRFVLVYKLPESEVKGRPTPISYGFVDANSVIWLCNEDALYLYDSNTQKVDIHSKRNKEKRITEYRTD